MREHLRLVPETTHLHNEDPFLDIELDPTRDKKKKLILDPATLKAEHDLEMGSHG